MKKFFVSTAIDYPSGLPHAGHLYEKICADVIARWHRLKGEKVHFSTGLDCHGQKIAENAKRAGLDPPKFVASMEPHYRQLCTNYNISFNDFIKTTEERHRKVVYQIFKKINEKGDIYKGEYQGLYCVDCETYYTPHEIEKGNNCPVHHKPLQTLKEESYFFRMSKYQTKLIESLKKTDLLWPVERRNEILARLEQPLRDLSVSRRSLKWGIPFPLDKKHVFFVWMDALVNYLTTIDYPNQKFKEFWPSDAHVIGRDIVWHHTVIWWSLLLSAEIELPRVISHGFINTDVGDKMSKSAGEVIDPKKLAEQFGADSLRYFLLREIPFGQDGVFSLTTLQSRVNNELANELGNLLNRTIALTEKKLGGKVSKQKTSSDLEKQLELDKISQLMDDFSFHLALREIFGFVSACNKYVNDQKPWEQSEQKATIILYNLVDALRVIAILLEPFIPNTSEKINAQIGVKKGLLKEAKLGLLEKTTVKKGPILFSKIDEKELAKEK
ncbi:methionine--tRNA ligase [Candidatus Micrarchaeota archaeon]|nr:methionine--tRNA ligase [Candidatus Micrarchaeota archaeon]MBU1930491.1 methionine--tRNA ligase [Candidatus Micrarchaeota archaeon]